MKYIINQENCLSRKIYQCMYGYKVLATIYCLSPRQIKNCLGYIHNFWQASVLFINQEKYPTINPSYYRALFGRGNGTNDSIRVYSNIYPNDLFYVELCFCNHLSNFYVELCFCNRLSIQLMMSAPISSRSGSNRRSCKNPLYSLMSLYLEAASL